MMTRIYGDLSSSSSLYKIMRHYFVYFRGKLGAGFAARFKFRFCKFGFRCPLPVQLSLDFRIISPPRAGSMSWVQVKTAAVGLVTVQQTYAGPGSTARYRDLLPDSANADATYSQLLHAR